MSQRLFKRAFSAFVLLTLLSLTCLGQSARADGIKIEFPSGGRLQIESGRGIGTLVNLIFPPERVRLIDRTIAVAVVPPQSAGIR